MTRLLAQAILLVVVAGFAWRKGEWPERASATALLATLFIDQVAHRVFGMPWGPYDQLHPWHFTLDCALLAVILSIALKADRLWTLWLGSAQILAVAGHVARALSADIHPMIYAILERYPFWMAIVITAWGTRNVAHRKRMAAQKTRAQPTG